MKFNHSNKTYVGNTHILYVELRLRNGSNSMAVILAMRLYKCCKEENPWSVIDEQQTDPPRRIQRQIRGS